MLRIENFETRGSAEQYSNETRKNDSSIFIVREMISPFEMK